MGILKKVCSPIKKPSAKRNADKSSESIVQRKIDQEVGDGVG